MVPQFDAVDDVLPEDVAARTHRGERIEISVGNPDGESSIFLAQSLTGLLRTVEEMADVAAHGKLHQAEEQAEEGDEQ